MEALPTHAEYFGHVRTIIGMVLGLSVARLVNGMTRFVQHPGTIKVYPVHLGWVVFLFITIVHFWWYEFHLSLVPVWTFPLYVDAGLFIVQRKDLPRYLEMRRPVQLRWSSTVKIASADLPALTFGRSKGLGFDRVIVYPTKEMMDWLKSAQSALKAETRAKLYVALTRARHTKAVVHDLADGEVVPGFTLFQ
jgi:hypothetical protein